MPSRRSDRGGAVRRQLERAEAEQPALNEAIEERRRFEEERDYLYRVGWEEFDSLDANTRQDLIRESAVFGGLSELFNAATSPRKVAMRAGAKEVLKRYVPNVARRLWARTPSRSERSLMDRIKQVRADRSTTKQQKKARIKEIEKDLAKNREGLIADSNKRAAESVARGEYSDVKAPKLLELLKDPKFMAALGLKTGSNYQTAIVRDALRSEDEQGNKQARGWIESVLALGENRLPRMSPEERELRRHQKELARSDDMYTATDEEYEAAFRRKAREDASHN
jgi:hypothetical protein